MEARLGVLDLRQEMLYEVGIHQRDMGFDSTIEIEEKHTGRYGAKGQEREEKRKATPEEIAKQNQWRRQRDVRRLIKWNFHPVITG
mgnify:CR=1 FL=1